MSHLDGNIYTYTIALDSSLLNTPLKPLSMYNVLRLITQRRMSPFDQEHSPSLSDEHIWMIEMAQLLVLQGKWEAWPRLFEERDLPRVVALGWERGLVVDDNVVQRLRLLVKRDGVNVGGALEGGGVVQQQEVSTISVHEPTVYCAKSSIDEIKMLPLRRKISTPQRVPQAGGRLDLLQKASRCLRQVNGHSKKKPYPNERSTCLHRAGRLWP